MVSRCCINQCGILLPLLVNGAYRGDGRTIVEFNVATSLTCGIPVIDVLQGNLQGLMGRDDIIELNPNADSMRLKMEVSSPSTLWSSPRLIVREVARL